jgi:NADH dehydrogenase FAD-containing subunit
MRESIPRVVIVGGGFGGLAAARALKRAPVSVIIIDRANHHLFQPLLYQVATSVLSPGQIGSPIRGIVGRNANTTVILGEVTGVDKDKRCVFVTSVDRENVPVEYDFLILATGVTHSYFGHNEFAPFAPGLKSLADAVAIRNRILQAFEQAEAEEDPARHRDLLTFVLVGAGPTGVEMAGALAVLVRNTLKAEFRRVRPESARIILLDMAPRVLGTFDNRLSEAARKRLERLGVEVRLGHSVDGIDADGVIVGTERLSSKTVIWTAGVSPSPAGKWLNVGTDRAGRVRVEQDLSVPGRPEIFVVGDTASLDQDGKPLPRLQSEHLEPAALIIQQAMATDALLLEDREDRKRQFEAEKAAQSAQAQNSAKQTQSELGKTVSIPRSAPCPCKSGEKYKRCCGKNAPPVLSTQAA